jgi:hypothetical protein
MFETGSEHHPNGPQQESAGFSDRLHMPRELLPRRFAAPSLEQDPADKNWWEPWPLAANTGQLAQRSNDVASCCQAPSHDHAMPEQVIHSGQEQRLEQSRRN